MPPRLEERSLRITQISEWFAVDDAGTSSMGATRALFRWSDAHPFSAAAWFRRS